MIQYRYEVHTHKKIRRKYLIDKSRDSDIVAKKLEELRKRGENELNVYLERDFSSNVYSYNIYTTQECSEDFVIVSFTSITDAEKYIMNKLNPDNYWIVEKRYNDCTIL